MRISSLLICDFAQVREGLLTICSGGISRVSVAQFPAQLSLMMASLLELGPEDIGPIHEITWRVSHVDVAETVAAGVAGVQVTEVPGAQPGELIQVPIVIDLRGLSVTASGQHDIKLSVDGAPELEIRSLWITPPGT